MMKSKECRQRYSVDDIAKSGLSCADCRMCRGGVCADRLVDRGKVDASGYNPCLRPDDSLLLPAINKLKVFTDSDCPEQENNSAAMKYLRAVIDRYEGAPLKAVISDYKLFSVRPDGKVHSLYSMYVKDGLALASRRTLSEKETAAVAKWALDDGVHALTEWNPFDRDVNRLKVQKLNAFGKKLIGTEVYLDGAPYRVLNQERGNLFVALETPTEKFKGADGWFVGSGLEFYLNNGWLEKHPEAKARLVHKIRVVTAQNLRDYPALSDCPVRYWASVMPDDRAGDGYGALADGRDILREDAEKEHYIRPAFWIAPSELSLETVKAQVVAAVENEERRGVTGKAHPARERKAAVTALPSGCISELLDIFKEHEEAVGAERLPEDEETLYRAHLAMELTELREMSKLGEKDFALLCAARDIETRI